MATPLPIDEPKIIPDLLKNSVKNYPTHTAYGEWSPQSKSWVYVTWKQFDDKVNGIRKALQAEGLEKGDRVAVLLPNSINAAAVDQAILGEGLVPVPLHAVDTPASSSYIINDSESALLIVPKTLRWNAMTAVCKEFPHLKKVIVTGEDEPENSDNSPVPVEAFNKWVQDASNETLKDVAIDEEDLGAIVYTSGTTGNPKGVMLTHKNVVSNVLGCSKAIILDCNDIYLSFLPFSHTFERTVTYYLGMYVGASVVFSRGVAKLVEDLQQIRPTMFISVPRVYEQFYNKIMAKIKAKGALTAAFADHAVDVGWRRFCRRNNLAVPSSSISWSDNLLWPVLEKLFAKPVQQAFGGRLKLAVAGGASLNNTLGRFYCSLGVPLRQGYGLTETSPVVCVGIEGSTNPLTVGHALWNVSTRIGEDKELQIKAPSVMKGYWKLPEATKAVFTEDGWLKTGDQADISEQGRIRINGRIKEIIVTSTGEKIPPTDLELAIQSDHLFEQVMCIGEGRPFITALAVLNPEEWKKFAASLNVDPNDPASLTRRDVRLAAIRRIKKSAQNFPQYGVPRNVSLLLEPWTVDNGMLTVTMKLRRKKIAEKYKDLIEELYQTPQSNV